MLISVPIYTTDRCLLKENQPVDFETPFLEKKVEEEVNVSIAKSLGVPPQKIFHYLKKFVGELIEKDEIIAINKSVFSTKKIISKYTGQIKEINHSDGSITISSKTKIDNVVNAFFKGNVNKIKKNEILVETNKGEQFSAKNVSLDFGGKTFFLENNSNFVSENLLNSVVVCDSITTYFKTKAEALGCQGFLTLTKSTDESEIPHAQFKNIDDYKKITKQQFPYCTIVSTSSMIYFYQ